MKRIISLLCAATMALTLLAACNQQQASVAIGVVDEAAAFKDNKVAKAAMDYLQEVGKPMQTEAETAYKAMQENQTEETVAAYKLAMGKLQNAMNQEQQRVVALVDAKFNEAMDKYRADKGLTVILSKQSVISASETVDITADIVALMDSMEIDFSKPEAPAPAPAPEAPKADEAKPEAEQAKE